MLKSHLRPFDKTKSNSIPKHSDVLVIGAGFGGIAAALRMRAKGYSVTIVDRLQAIGGRAQVFHKGGFLHDAGPTLITAPFLMVTGLIILGYPCFFKNSFADGFT